MKLARLREVRELHGWSQSKLAEEADVSRDGISNYETGNREAWPATAKKLADTLGVEIVDLVAHVEELVLAGKAEAPGEAGPEEEPERRRYGSRVWERINSLERAADQWQRFVDEGLYDLKSVNLETLKVTDAASLAVILAHGPEAAEMKRAATGEQRERLELAERRLIDTNLDFWARVESELARGNVAYLDEVRAERAPWKEVLGSNTASG